jgi:hypothetical protein
MIEFTRRNNRMSNSSHTLTRYVLGVLLAFVALNAFAGGYYGMSGAESVPLAWLDGSPFHNYFVPGLILLIVVGGSLLFAAIAVFARLRVARPAAFGAVAVLAIWLTVQVAIIGYISWMQPTTATVGFVVFILTLLLPKETREAQ